LQPGDIVFSYAAGVIQGFGITQTHCYTSPRPDEFGHIGEVWDELGWRVDVNFDRIAPTMRPAEHMDVLAPVLPGRYSPLSEIGHGYQHVYLASVPRKMAVAVAQLMSPMVLRLVTTTAVAEEANIVDTELLGINEWNEVETNRILGNKTLAETTRKALIKARIGQGLFRRNVASIEHRCRVTGVTYAAHLFASHIKPWRESTNDERLNGENGLLLTPSIDHLFDRGFISFEDNGELVLSDVAHKESVKRMGVDTEHVVRVGEFSEGQKFFLAPPSTRPYSCNHDRACLAISNDLPKSFEGHIRG